MVHFVGAGSGAVDLITVRGAEILKNTDVVIYAGSLVNPELISTYCKEDVEIYNSAKMTLEEVTEVEIESNCEGKDVARLHTGDPSLYSAIHEQIEILCENDIPYDVTPGVSAFSAAAAALGCELTIPGVSQSLTITRIDGRTRVPEKESLSSYAKHHATLALYLSAGQAEKVRDELTSLDNDSHLDGALESQESAANREVSGFSTDTPVAVVYKASWPDQKIILTTLGEMPRRMTEEDIHNFALILVGDALKEGKIKNEENSKLYDKDFETGFRKVNNKSKILIFSFTLHGDLVMQEIVSKYSKVHPEIEFIGKIKHDTLEKGTTKYIVADYFSKVKAIIFISAIGIAVREIAPYIKNKATDPAVVVVDELGENVIPILSGHLGGANDLAIEISEILSAHCIITTATDLEHKFAVDEFAKKHNFYITDLNKAKEISAKVLRNEDISINKGLDSDIIITPFNNKNTDALILIPRFAAIGIGCRKGVSADEISAAVDKALSENNLYKESVFQFSTIDIKLQEKGLIEFFTKNHFDYNGYSAKQLQEVDGDFLKSDFVEKTVGVDNVSGRASLLLAEKAYEELSEEEKNYYETPYLLSDKTVYGNVTVAISII